ncbi:MAG: 2,3-cyclic 3-phosphodiesterase [Baekduia sp.]|nr:2,3-cyclic 3-phosphodiesterase [Baekduia sp.]
MRVVAPESVHLTMAFLGHRALDEIEPLSALVASFDGRPAPEPLETAGALWLSPRRPHVLTVAAADRTGVLRTLHEELWSGLEALGHVREQRMFRPHLTVARVRHGWTAPSSRLPELPDRPLRPGGLVLLRSWLGGGPARYEALSHAGFAAES